MADKCFDPDDPMQFMGVGMGCDAATFDLMVETIVEEYMLLGWSDEHVLTMFRMPFYQLPYAIRQQKGEPYVKEIIARVRGAWKGGA